LVFTTDVGHAFNERVDIVLIAVGTPPRLRDGEADLAYVYRAVREIAFAAKNPLVVATKSTVPVKTGDTLQKLFRRFRPDTEILVASNPEFLREGTAVEDFMKPDRIVIGTNSEKALAKMRALYSSLVASGIPLFETDISTAELVKYASNAFLAMKVSFVNELADLCEQVGTNIQDISLGMGLDRRIGASFLQVGPGYGGSCFPKDTLALLRTAQDNGVALRLVEETVALNDARKRKMSRKVIEALHGDIEGCVVAVLGLAFKGNTDDVRESPAFPLIEGLQREGATIKAYDPRAMENAAGELSDVEFCPTILQCIEGADVVVVATDWEEFGLMDLEMVARMVKTKLLVDLRNIVDLEAARRSGLACIQLGRSCDQTYRDREHQGSTIGGITQIYSTAIGENLGAGGV
jgi:UDPglucose 6-dehydrogenase